MFLTVKRSHEDELYRDGFIKRQSDETAITTVMTTTTTQLGGRLAPNAGPPAQAYAGPLATVNGQPAALTQLAGRGIEVRLHVDVNN